MLHLGRKPKKLRPARRRRNDVQPRKADPSCYCSRRTVRRRPLDPSGRLCRQRPGRGQDGIRAGASRRLCQIVQSRTAPDVHGDQPGPGPLLPQQLAARQLHGAGHRQRLPEQADAGDVVGRQARERRCRAHGRPGRGDPERMDSQSRTRRRQRARSRAAAAEPAGRCRQGDRRSEVRPVPLPPPADPDAVDPRQLGEEDYLDARAYPREARGGRSDRCGTEDRRRLSGEEFL